jgi:hypothetical protein
MNTQRSTKVQQANGGARTPGRGIALVLAALPLLVVPSIASAQAPSPEEALGVVVEYLRGQTWAVGDWHLGYDADWASRQHPDAVVDAATHRGLLARIAEDRQLPFYPGEDFGRVVCDSSPDSALPAVNCRFPHGTRTMLMLTVVSSDAERGVTQVAVYSAIVDGTPHLHAGGVRAGRNTRGITLDVEYDPDGSPSVGGGERGVRFGMGHTPVDEIRGTPPGT